ncbi:hypothetical protein LAZ67_5002416 [Cordylochernes scorpioides]|uniref:Uncharacterized protein n=1 Tax=Cordylochernes scorpioides TaxID=51811 RepID=A0ABY6KL57_9ARAC|nr:hypothetical protein LAZ67_5002416 [Cordylochernes scorpioides]
MTKEQLTNLAALLANQGTEWKFNPPGAPYFGSLWEVGVKALKYHIKRIIGKQVLPYEEILTLQVQIESCLNSIPLYQHSLHSEKQEFPLRLAFPMTIYKAQGQTFARGGLLLQEPVFMHGQLFVAFSRVRIFDRIQVKLKHKC